MNNYVTLDFNKKHPGLFGDVDAMTEPLWQWDYGMILVVKGLPTKDTTEIHFYQKDSHRLAYRIAPEVEDVDIDDDDELHVYIPNLMLEVQQNIEVFVYITSKNVGQTVRKGIIPIKGRAQPADYVNPDKEEEVSNMYEAMVSLSHDVAEKAIEVGQTAEAVEQVAEEINQIKGEIDQTAETISQTAAEVSQTAVVVSENAQAVEDAKAIVEADKEIVESLMRNIDDVPTEGSENLVKSGGVWEAIQEGGGGTYDYNMLTNKPTINGRELSGDMELEDIGDVPIPDEDIVEAVNSAFSA